MLRLQSIKNEFNESRCRYTNNRCRLFIYNIISKIKGFKLKWKF